MFMCMQLGVCSEQGMSQGAKCYAVPPGLVTGVNATLLTTPGWHHSYARMRSFIQLCV